MSCACLEQGTKAGLFLCGKAGRGRMGIVENKESSVVENNPISERALLFLWPLSMKMTMASSSGHGQAGCVSPSHTLLASL